jgi:hypothetical protein
MSTAEVLPFRYPATSVPTQALSALVWPLQVVASKVDPGATVLLHRHSKKKNLQHTSLRQFVRFAG